MTRPTAISLLRQLAGVGVLTEQSSGPPGQLRYIAEDLLAALSDDVYRG